MTIITLTTDFGIRNDFGSLGISVDIPGFVGESVRTHALTHKSSPLSRQSLENHDFVGIMIETDFLSDVL